MKTVLDYIKEREKLRAMIRSAKIGVGANKLANYNGAERRMCQFRKTQWEIKLANAERELAGFDERMGELKVEEEMPCS